MTDSEPGPPPTEGATTPYDNVVANGKIHAGDSIPLLRDGGDDSKTSKDTSKAGVGEPSKDRNSEFKTNSSLMRRESAYADSARRERTGKTIAFVDQVCLLGVVMMVIEFRRDAQYAYSSWQCQCVA